VAHGLVHHVKISCLLHQRFKNLSVDEGTNVKVVELMVSVLALDAVSANLLLVIEAKELENLAVKRAINGRVSWLGGLLLLIQIGAPHGVGGRQRSVHLPLLSSLVGRAFLRGRSTD